MSEKNQKFRSITIFHFGETKISFHWTFIVIIGLFLLYSTEEGLDSVIPIAVNLFLVFSTLFLSCSGHYFMANKMKYETEEILFFPFFITVITPNLNLIKKKH